MAVAVYTHATRFDGRSWVGSAPTVMLLRDTYTFDPTHSQPLDVEPHEASGTGYARVAVPSLALNIDNANDKAEYQGGALSWPGADFGSVRYAVVFVPTLDLLWFTIDFGAPVATNGQDATLTPPGGVWMNATDCLGGGVPNNGAPQDGFKWHVDDVRIMLVGTGHAYDPDNTVIADVVADEITAAGRKAVSGRSMFVDHINEHSEFRGNPTVWVDADFGTVKGAYLYLEGPTDAGRVLRGYLDFGAGVLTTGLNFTVADGGVYMIGKEC